MDRVAKEDILNQLRLDADERLLGKIRDLWKTHSICEDKRDIEGILTTLTPTCRYEIINTSYQWLGKTGAAQFYKELLTAIPDARFELQRVVVGPQGVFEEAILTGHHRGAFRAYPASERTIEASVGILFPWDGAAQLFTGERVYLGLDDVFKK